MVLKAVRTDFPKDELLQLTRVVYSGELLQSSPNERQTHASCTTYLSQIKRVVAPSCDTIWEILQSYMPEISTSV